MDGCGRELWGRRLLGFIVHDGFISGTIKAALVGDLHSRQTCTHLRFARPNEPSCCGQPEINQLSRLRRHFRRMRNNKSTIIEPQEPSIIIILLLTLVPYPPLLRSVPLQCRDTRSVPTPQHHPVHRLTKAIHFELTNQLT